MTFALVARCADTGMLGAAVASSSPAVAARCPYAEAGAGAFSSQNITDPRLGPAGLALMRAGASAPDAIAQLKQTNDNIEYRQLLAVDSSGGAAVFSGERTLGVWAEEQTDNIACAGNLLADAGVARAMVDGFLSAPAAAHLGDRLMAALAAALRAGGEAGAVHSAGLKIAHRTAWLYADLRCDWSDDCPIAALAALWKLYKPQAEEYIQRAQDPAAAPGYGVPGDDRR